MLRVKEVKFLDSTIDADGALVMRFQATGRKTGPVWEPGQFLTDLPGGFIITVYPNGAAGGAAASRQPQSEGERAGRPPQGRDAGGARQRAGGLSGARARPHGQVRALLPDQARR